VLAISAAFCGSREVTLTVSVVDRPSAVTERFFSKRRDDALARGGGVLAALPQPAARVERRALFQAAVELRIVIELELVDDLFAQVARLKDLNLVLQRGGIGRKLRQDRGDVGHVGSCGYPT